FPNLFYLESELEGSRSGADVPMGIHLPKEQLKTRHFDSPLKGQVLAQGLGHSPCARNHAAERAHRVFSACQSGSMLGEWSSQGGRRWDGQAHAVALDHGWQCTQSLTMPSAKRMVHVNS